MRKFISAFVSILAISILISACSKTDKEPEKKAADEISQRYVTEAHELMEKGDYENALRYYEWAGEKGKPYIKDCFYKKIIDTIVKTKDVNECERAIRQVRLDAASSKLLTEEEYQEALSEAMIQKTEQIYDKLMWEQNLFTDSLERLLELAKKENIKQEKLNQIEDIYHTCEGLWLFSIWDRNETNEERAIEEWRKCSDNSIGKKLLETYYATKNGDILKAIEEVEKILPTSQQKEIYINALVEYAKEQNIYNDVNGLLQIHKIAYDHENYLQNKNGTITKSFKTSYAIKAGIDGLSGDLEISADYLKEIKKSCGKEPNSKILILYKGKEFKTNKSKYFISESLMDNLPEEYYPETVEEVEYVILIDVSFNRTGRYQYTGAVRILEKATVSLYTADKKTPIWKSDVIFGEQDDTMEYYGYAPEYYSKESPKISEALITITETIEELELVKNKE